MLNVICVTPQAFVAIATCSTIIRPLSKTAISSVNNKISVGIYCRTLFHRHNLANQAVRNHYGPVRTVGNGYTHRISVSAWAIFSLFKAHQLWPYIAEHHDQLAAGQLGEFQGWTGHTHTPTYTLLYLASLKIPADAGQQCRLLVFEKQK